MRLTMTVLARELNWGLIQNTNTQEDILSVRSLDGSGITYHANTLYIGTLADMKALPSGRPLMFLCSDKCSDAVTIPYNLNVLYPNSFYTVSECESIVMDMLERVGRVSSCSHLMYESLISGKGLEKIILTAQSIFDNLILVLDRKFKILSFSDSRQQPATGTWKEILESGQLPEQYIRKIENPDFADIICHKYEPVTRADNQSPGGYIMCYIKNNGNVDGYTVLAESNRPLTDTDIVLFKTFNNIVSYDYRRTHTLRDPKTRIYEQLITEILGGNLKDQQIQDRLAQIRPDLKKLKFVFVFGFFSDNTGKNKPLEPICDHIGMIVQTENCSVYKDKIVMLVSSDTRTALPPAIFNELRTFVKNNGMICGISNHFTDILDLPKAFRQSQAVLHLGKRLQRSESMLQYWTFSCLDMLESLQDKNNLLEYCNPTLQAMLDYDAENKTSYTKTLRLYIDSGKNSNKTAKELGVHRNTVDYRINRIRELFDVDFENPQLMFSFELSYRIFYFIDKYYLDLRPTRFFLLD